MLAQLADLRLCALMSLRPYVPAPLCPCALMSVPLCPATLCPAPFCLCPYVVDRPWAVSGPRSQTSLRDPLCDFRK